MAVFSLFERFLVPPRSAELSPSSEVEELHARLTALELRLAPSLSKTPTPPPALRRVAEALERLAEAEAQPRSCDDRVDEISWLSPDATSSGPSTLRSKDGGHGLTAAGFGGPWLPRRLAGVEPLEPDPWKALDGLLLSLEMCRRDRARYFEQVLECRELILTTAGRSGGSAPAENRRNHATQAAAFSAPRRSATPRGRLPPLPPPKQRGSAAPPARRWDLFWQELTSSDPAILSLDRGRGSDSRPSPRQGSQGSQGNQGRAPLSARSEEGWESHRSSKEAMVQHLQQRRELERQLSFWEAETLKLCERNRRADVMLKWAQRVLCAREELEDATFQLLALYPAKVRPDNSNREMPAHAQGEKG